MSIRVRLNNSQPHKSVDNIALVAGTPGGAESLTLGALSAAFKARGVRPLIFTFRVAADMESVARRILLTFPSLVCVFLPNGNATITGIALIRLLRRKGYTGHITTGGAYAAANAEQLLSLFPQIDSVIGDDGKQPLMHLAESICHNRYPETIKGVHTHSGATNCSAAAQHAFLCRDSFSKQVKARFDEVQSVTNCQTTKPTRKFDYVRLIKSFPVTADTLQPPTEGK